MAATLHQGDAVAWLRSLPSESVDLIITDIAYESLEKHRAVGTTTRLKQSDGSSNAWFEIFPNTRIPSLLDECFRVLKRDSHFYFYCDQETMFVAKPMAEAAGFTFWKPLVLDKVSIGMGYHYRARYEFILFFEKGKRQVSDLGIADILTAKGPRGIVCERCLLDSTPPAVKPPRPRAKDVDKPSACPICNGPRRKTYATEKHPGPIRTLIEQSTEPGALVIDPFCGSGAVGVAAAACGRSFAGNDLADDAIALSLARIPGLTVVADAPPVVESAFQPDLFGATP